MKSCFFLLTTSLRASCVFVFAVSYFHKNRRHVCINFKIATKISHVQSHVTPAATWFCTLCSSGPASAAGLCQKGLSQRLARGRPCFSTCCTKLPMVRNAFKCKATECTAEVYIIKGCSPLHMDCSNPKKLKKSDTVLQNSDNERKPSFKRNTIEWAELFSFFKDY